MVDIKFLFAYFLRKTTLNFPVHQSGETSVQPKLPPATPQIFQIIKMF